MLLLCGRGAHELRGEALSGTHVLRFAFERSIGAISVAGDSRRRRTLAISAALSSTASTARQQAGSIFRRVGSGVTALLCILPRRIEMTRMIERISFLTWVNNVAQRHLRRWQKRGHAAPRRRVLWMDNVWRRGGVSSAACAGAASLNRRVVHRRSRSSSRSPLSSISGGCCRRCGCVLSALVASALACCCAAMAHQTWW